MKKKNQKGFTLIEIMVTVVVLSAGVLAVAAMQTTAINGNASARGQTRATVLARDRLELLMTLPFNHPAFVDTNGDGAPGLDNDNDTRNDYILDPVNSSIRYPAAADQADPNNPIDGRYNVYWNTVQPGNNTITIRVVTTWIERGRGRRVAIDYMKPRVF